VKPRRRVWEAPRQRAGYVTPQAHKGGKKKDVGLGRRQAGCRNPQAASNYRGLLSQNTG